MTSQVSTLSRSQSLGPKVFTSARICLAPDPQGITPESQWEREMHRQASRRARG